MIIITSISPSHKNFENQSLAVKSWEKFNPISVNHKSEHDKIRHFNVKLVETENVNTVLFKRPYPLISEIINVCKGVDSEYFFITNSDIILGPNFNFDHLKQYADKGLFLINRSDYDHDMNTSIQYREGFDGFLISKKHLDIFPMSTLCLGQCFWDYWLPFQYVVNKLPIFKTKTPLIFHKKHDIQYSMQDWKKTAGIFSGEMAILDPKIKAGMESSRLSSYVFEQIKKHSKYVS
jgi:hypothetical protein